MCLWWVAGKLGLKNQKGVLLRCHTPDGMTEFVHAVLSKVTVKMLLKVAKFTAVCNSYSLMEAILTKVVTDKYRFKMD